MDSPLLGSSSSGSPSSGSPSSGSPSSGSPSSGSPTWLLGSPSSTLGSSSSTLGSTLDSTSLLLLGRRSGCARNGTSVQMQKTQLTAPYTPSTSTDRSFVYSSTRASPSEHVKAESSKILLALSSTPDNLDWLGDFIRDLEGESWQENNALITDSLGNLALCCYRSKNVSLFSAFCKMLNELMFTAKINSFFNAQELADPSKMPTLVGILNKLKEEGFSGSNLGTWLSSGSHWAQLASTGSVYLLLLIASKCQVYHIGSEVTCTVLAEVANQIRAPSQVRYSIIPSVLKLQKSFSVTLPVLFSANLRKTFCLPSTLDIAQLEVTDWFFDLFYQRLCVNVPRDKMLWKEVLEYKPLSENLVSFYSFNQLHLNSTIRSGDQTVSAWDKELGPLSDDEEDNIKQLRCPSPVQPLTVAFAREIINLQDSEKWGPLYVVKSSFNASKALAPPGTGLPYTPTNCKKWTEDQRKIVKKGEHPETLELFSENLQTRYDPKTGTIRAQQKWLILTQKAIAGREVKVVDAEGKTILTVDSTLSEEH
ncbi:hypothetical protein FB446DRAFT_791796 [Lentinula raphanica]|nr:hypothetical protein FB446DRAFT_791796 [Lentinula raphanica]